MKYNPQIILWLTYVLLTSKFGQKPEKKNYKKKT